MFIIDESEKVGRKTTTQILPFCLLFCRKEKRTFPTHTNVHSVRQYGSFFLNIFLQIFAVRAYSKRTHKCKATLTILHFPIFCARRLYFENKFLDRRQEPATTCVLYVFVTLL